MADDDHSLLARRLAPGDMLHLDFRSAEARSAAYTGGYTSEGTVLPLRVVTWNIERGYKTPAILAELRRLSADVICLQEIDSGCDRSDGIDVGIVLARALGMNYLFQQEFVELGSSAARPALPGVHGNGILTRFDITEAHSLDHRCQPYCWPRDGAARGEPRLGRRFTLAGVVALPARYLASDTSPLGALLAGAKGQGQQGLDTPLTLSLTHIPPAVVETAAPILTEYASLTAPESRAGAAGSSSPSPTVPFAVYTAHAELFCGASHRLDILADIIQHSRVLFEPSLAPTTAAASANASSNASGAATGTAQSALVPTLIFPPSSVPRTRARFQAFGGDLNTLAHSIARLSKDYCRDALRWRSLGWSESEWLAALVWGRYDYEDKGMTRDMGGKSLAFHLANTTEKPPTRSPAPDPLERPGESLLLPWLGQDPSIEAPLPLPGAHADATAAKADAGAAVTRAAGSVGPTAGAAATGPLPAWTEQGPAPRYRQQDPFTGYGRGRLATVCAAFALPAAPTSSGNAATAAAACAPEPGVYHAPDPDAVAAAAGAVVRPNSTAEETGAVASTRLPLPLSALTNPGFEEAFPRDTETLRNYHGLFTGKLDHLFTRGFAAVAAGMHNEAYDKSDHRALRVDGYLVPARLWPLRTPHALEDAAEAAEREAARKGPKPERDPFTSPPARKERVPDLLDPGVLVRVPAKEGNGDLWVPVLPCHLKLAYVENKGLFGYLSRACTPTVLIAAQVIATLFVLNILIRTVFP